MATPGRGRHGQAASSSWPRPSAMGWNEDDGKEAIRRWQRQRFRGFGTPEARGSAGQGRAGQEDWDDHRATRADAVCRRRVARSRPAESLGSDSRPACWVLARSTCSVSRAARERRRDRCEAQGPNGRSSARDGRLRNARGAPSRAQYVSLPRLSCGSGGSCGSGTPSSSLFSISGSSPNPAVSSRVCLHGSFSIEMFASGTGGGTDPKYA
jgi:hypothetical protein